MRVTKRVPKEHLEPHQTSTYSLLSSLKNNLVAAYVPPGLSSYEQPPNVQLLPHAVLTAHFFTHLLLCSLFAPPPFVGIPANQIPQRSSKAKLHSDIAGCEITSAHRHLLKLSSTFISHPSSPQPATSLRLLRRLANHKFNIQPDRRKSGFRIIQHLQ